MADREWRSNEVLAWTDSEGPGKPPPGASPVLAIGLAATLGVVMTGLVLSDSLCAEHRAWVMALGSIAIVGLGVAVVSLLRGGALAPLLTLGSASLGVSIGLIDAVHEPARGTVIAIGFGLASMGSCWLVYRQLVLHRWQQRVEASIAPVPATEVADVTEHATEPDPATTRR